MKATIISHIVFIVGFSCGCLTGHFHGTSQVYEGIFGNNVKVMEAIGGKK